MDTRLAMTVTHADGTISRWAPDEVDAADVPGGLTFGTSVPGGFKDASCSLLRRIDKTYADQALFDTVRIYGAGGQTAFEGRLVQFPRSHGTGFSITPGAVGWSAHLLDDASFCMIYADRDLSGWGTVRLGRQIALVNAGRHIGDISVVPDDTTSLPSIKTSLTQPWPGDSSSEAFYDAGPGNRIAKIYYAWQRSTQVSTSDTNWSWQVQAWQSDDISGGSNTTGNLIGAGPGSNYINVDGYRYGLITQSYGPAGDSSTGGKDYSIFWRPVVYGDHGITLQGPDPGGFYASDVIPHILKTAAPLLTYTTGVDGSIQQTSFIIPHLVFRDPGTAQDAILQTNKFHQWEWGVWEGREFFYRAPDPTRLTWQARLSSGAQLDLDGLSADDVYNGVVVQWTDPAGTGHTAGPPGSRCEATDASLADTSPDNPVNAHGIPRRYAILNVSQTTTQAGAIQIGAVWLKEAALSGRKGSMRLTGTVTHPTKGERPVWEVRAGDFVSISDHPDTVPRRIIETSYDHDSRTITLSLDNTVDKLTALLERMGVNLVGVL